MARCLPAAALTLAVAVFAAAGCTSDSPPAAGPTTAPTPGGTATPTSPPPQSPPPQTPPTTTGTGAATGRRPPIPTITAADRPQAQELRSQTRCGPAGSQIGIADLSWRPAASRGKQRVVFTPYADGYRTGRYNLTPDLGPETTRTSLQQLSPGSVYTWLVLTRQGETWQPSATATFAAPTCVSDQTGGG